MSESQSTADHRSRNFDELRISTRTPEWWGHHDVPGPASLLSPNSNGTLFDLPRHSISTVKPSYTLFEVIFDSRFQLSIWCCSTESTRNEPKMGYC
jgi:hypothetical protein